VRHDPTTTAANQTTDATLLVIADAAMLENLCETFIALSAPYRFMRNGKTYIRVTIDPRFYSFNSDVGPTGLTPLNLDLMKIRLSNYTSYRSPHYSVNNEEASTDKFHIDSGHALWVARC
jgi:hypothetical protein